MSSVEPETLTLIPRFNLPKKMADCGFRIRVRVSRLSLTLTATSNCIVLFLPTHLHRFNGKLTHLFYLMADNLSMSSLIHCNKLLYFLGLDARSPLSSHAIIWCFDPLNRFNCDLMFLITFVLSIKHVQQIDGENLLCEHNERFFACWKMCCEVILITPHSKKLTNC